MSLSEMLLNAEFFYSILRVTTPILFAALAALVSNKAGIMNVGIEGTMAFSSLMGVIASAFTQNLFLGFMVAIATGIIYSLLLFFMAIIMKSHQFLTGIAMNLLAEGGTVFLLYTVTGDKGNSEALPSLILPKIDLPLVRDIPLLGEILSGHNILTYIAFVSVILLALFFCHTKLGLRIRAVGENEVAAASVGIHVPKIKFIALVISGIFSGMGGAFMSMGYVSFFSANMIAGRGFIGFAAEAIGHSTPVGTMLASLLFGALDALANSLQMTSIPLQFVQMLPYLVTVLLFTVYSMRKTKEKIKMEVDKA